jgi:hypothetical protein
VREALSRQGLEAAHCWEANDRVPPRPEMTEFRRALRDHQAQWREANRHPIGSQPITPKPGDGMRLVGSWLGTRGLSRYQAGGTGIRTWERVAPLTVFKTAAIATDEARGRDPRTTQTPYT